MDAGWQAHQAGGGSPFVVAQPLWAYSVNYLLTPIDQHFDLGFGSVANSFKHAADSVLSSQSESPSLNAHLPASFLYRHSIELFLKSGIIIFHRKFQIPFDQEPSDSEPKVVVGSKWKPMYSVHGVQDLYFYFRSLVFRHAEYLAEHTRTNWEFPQGNRSDPTYPTAKFLSPS